MIPTLPHRARNRLAETILAALHDTSARRELEALAGGASSVADADRGADLRQLRARRAREALADLPLSSREPSLSHVLCQAAALFDAGLGFEVHELLEPYWAGAEGSEREALQGLIQIAVGYQHLANGNLDGARALLSEGADRLGRGRLGDLPLAAFSAAVRAGLSASAAGERTAVPRFPR